MRRLTGKHPQQQVVGHWIYKKMKDVLRATRIMTNGDYIAWQCDNVTKITKLRILLKECRGTKGK